MKKSVILVSSLLFVSYVYCMDKEKKSGVPKLSFSSNSPKSNKLSHSQGNAGTPKSNRLSPSSGSSGTPKTPIKSMHELGEELRKTRSERTSAEYSSQKK